MSWSEREEDLVQEAADLIWREHGRVNGTPCYEAALRMLQCSRAAEERGFRRGVLTAAGVKAMTENEALALVEQVENDHAVYAGNVFAVARWKQLRAIVLGAAAAEERGRRWQEKEMETLRGAVTLANEEIRRLVAAAHDSEERGRRRGEAERDELRDRMHQTIAFLLSCVASGEQLSNEEEVGIRAMLREALAPRDSAPVCDAVLSSDPFREWRCGKLKGHEGPHSGEAPRDSGGTR